MKPIFTSTFIKCIGVLEFRASSTVKTSETVQYSTLKVNRNKNINGSKVLLKVSERVFLLEFFLNTMLHMNF